MRLRNNPKILGLDVDWSARISVAHPEMAQAPFLSYRSRWASVKASFPSRFGDARSPFSFYNKNKKGEKEKERDGAGLCQLSYNNIIVGRIYFKFLKDI